MRNTPHYHQDETSLSSSGVSGVNPRQTVLMVKKHSLLPGTLNLLVLKSIGDQKLHGLEIQQRIEMTSGKVFGVEEGSLYPALHRMANEGLIVGSWAVTERGRRGKYYVLTPKGKKQLQSEIDSWRVCSEAIERVLNFA